MRLADQGSNSDKVIGDFCRSRWHWDMAKWKSVCVPDR